MRLKIKLKYSYIGQGVLRAIILTLLCLMGYTLINSVGNLDIKESTFSIIFIVITLVSVLYGAGYASRKAEENGWIIGMLVGICYIVLIYIVSMLAGRQVSFGLKDLCRVLLCVFAGTLSGMLGINL